LVAESGRRRLYDLGSGAGLPGLPIALVLGDLLDETVLVERREKRVSFLRGAVPVVLGAYRRTASGDIPGTIPPAAQAAQAAPVVRVLSADADNLAATEGDALGTAVVVFRAFRQTTEDTLASLAAAFPPETPVCAFKGKIEQTRDEAARIRASGWAMTGPEEHAPRVVPVDVPGLDAERSLLIWHTARRNTG
jgi:16S rRNA (guanine527-N7)-methyltransferase